MPWSPMKACSSLLVFVLYIATISIIIAAADKSDQTYDTCSNNNDDSATCTSPSPYCNLYIAPSTIPNAGLGAFTTVPLKSGHVFEGQVIYPILKLDTTHYRNPFENFVWEASTLGMTMETTSPDNIHGLCPGFDAVLNSNLAIINIKGGGLDYDDQVGGHCSLSPSAGSMTPYHNSKSIVSHDIPPGGELFKSYGDIWFEERYQTFGLVPLTGDYPKAEQLLKTLRGLEHKLDLSTPARHDLYSVITNIKFESRTMNALPREYMHIDTIVKESSMRAWHEQNATKPIEQLQETGRCIDNIHHDKSTLPFAGRGAFASRPIRRGDIITGSPLIHVPSMDMELLFKEDDNSTQYYQIWINYCMAHRDGDLLLCPYGMGVNYMNHNSTLANVKLQWCPDGILSQNDTWFHKSSWTRNEVSSTHLGMDYVASRDIEDGEELFLDYGDEWEEAWQAHVANWKARDEDRAYVSATQWNMEHANDTIRTQEEQKQSNPYPGNLLLHCSTVLLKFSYSPKWRKRQNVWAPNDKGKECHVLDRIRGENGALPTYIVQVIDPEGKKNRTQHDIPRNFLRMVDAPYSTDWHRRDAFRHWIGIPDDMFPTAWKRFQKA